MRDEEKEVVAIFWLLDHLGGVHYRVKRQEMKPIPVLILFLDCPLTK
jgi:hypothetical protein